jgi:hypothetical protein
MTLLNIITKARLQRFKTSFWIEVIVSTQNVLPLKFILDNILLTK